MSFDKYHSSQNSVSDLTLYPICDTKSMFTTAHLNEAVSICEETEDAGHEGAREGVAAVPRVSGTPATPRREDELGSGGPGRALLL